MSYAESSCTNGMKSWTILLPLSHITKLCNTANCSTHRVTTTWYHPSLCASLVRHFNGVLGRKKAENSKIATLPPYLHPAEKASGCPQQMYSKCCCRSFSLGMPSREDPSLLPNLCAGAGLLCAEAAPSPRPHIQILSMKAFHRCIFGIFLVYHALLVHSQKTHQLQRSPSKTFLNIHFMRVISRSHRKLWKRFIKLFFFQDNK